jgi:hypothetical protein
MEGALNAMFLTKIKTAVMGLTLFGLVATGAGVLAFQDLGDPRNQPPKAKGTVAQPAPEKGRPAGTLPGGTTTTTSPAPLVEAAKNAFETTLKMYRGGEAPQDPVVRWSQLWLESQLMASDTPLGRAAAYEAHVERMKMIEDRSKVHLERGQATDLDRKQDQFYRLQAEQWLDREKAGLSPKGGGNQPGGKDPRSQAVLQKLDEPIAMNFANETPLEDVLKYIKAATSGKNAEGIPIYVDRSALSNAGVTLTAPVQIDLEGVPLRTTLALLLQSLELDYTIEDGVLIISQPDRIGMIAQSIRIHGMDEQTRRNAKPQRD